jgi:hypothetical protein
MDDPLCDHTKASDSAKTPWGLDDEYAVLDLDTTVQEFYCCACSHWFEDANIRGCEIPPCPLCGEWDNVFDADDMMDFPNEKETTDPWEEADHADNRIL